MYKIVSTKNVTHSLQTIVYKMTICITAPYKVLKIG